MACPGFPRTAAVALGSFDRYYRGFSCILSHRESGGPRGLDLFAVSCPPDSLPMRHVLSATVQNVPGVLAHVAGMFASRGYNIDSLAVGETEDPRLSRMTFVVV